MKRIDPERLAALIEAHAAAELAENRIGGKEIAVDQAGRPVFRRAFGFADACLPARRLYRAASMTKPITAAAVLRLADGGKLDPDWPAARFYPELNRMRVAEVRDGKIVSTRPARGVIRVSDLLSHTSGVGCSPVAEALADDNSALPLKEAVRRILSHPLSFDPRTAQAYSGTDAFDLAAGIVAMVSEMPFEEYLKREIFDPLGMVDTTFDPDPGQWARMVPMHKRTAAGESAVSETTPGRVFETFAPERTSAGAGLAVTADDYLRFAEMLRAGGVSADGARILSEAAVRRMSTPNVPAALGMSCEQWGLGVRVIAEPGYPHGLGVGCFGWSGAYGTHFWVDKENGIVAVLMKNSRYDGGAGNRSACELERDVTEALIADGS